MLLIKGRIGGTYSADPKEVLDAQFFDIDALPEGLLPSHRELIEDHRDWFKGDDTDRQPGSRAANQPGNDNCGTISKDDAAITKTTSSRTGMDAGSIPVGSTPSASRKPVELILRYLNTAGLPE